MSDDGNLLANWLAGDKGQTNLIDTARALLVAACNGTAQEIAQLPHYLEILRKYQQANGRFVAANADCEVTQAEICRALATLYAEMPLYRPVAERMLNALLPHLRHLNTSRAIASTILGLQAYLQVNYNRLELRVMLLELADRLVMRWRSNRQAGWQWFDKYLGDEAAHLPQALFASYTISGQERYRLVAQQAADWLAELFFVPGYLKLIGQANCYTPGKAKAEFDEMARDAGALVELFVSAYLVDGNESYAGLARSAFGWYNGLNCHQQPLYDATTVTCCTALTANGVSNEQSLGGTLAYRLAWHELLTLNERTSTNTFRIDSITHLLNYEAGS